MTRSEISVMLSMVMCLLEGI